MSFGFVAMKNQFSFASIGFFGQENKNLTGQIVCAGNVVKLIVVKRQQQEKLSVCL